MQRDHNLNRELAELINKYSLENGCHTADFILADYLKDCLMAFEKAVTAQKIISDSSQRLDNIEQELISKI